MGTNDIGKMRIGLTADPKELNRGLTRARQHIQGFAKVARTAGIAAAASFAAASAGMVVMARNGLDAVDAQAKLARTVDGSIDGMRALQIVAEDAGASASAVGDAAQMMGKRLAEAARDGFGPAHEMLERLGLSADELLEMDVDERFAAIADRAKELGMSSAQAADVLRQFGVRSAEVALILTQGGDAIRAARDEVADFGLSLSEDAAAGVERANDSLSRIGFVFEALRNQLAVQIAPVLEEVGERFKAMAGEGGPLREAVGRLSASFGNLISTIADPRFIEAATTFGVTIANAVSGLANVLVALTENAEIAATAMIALGSAMAFFMGPTGLAIAAIAGGVAILSTRLGETKTAAEEAAEAERLLSEQLATLDTSNSDAVASGKQLIETHISQARAAIEAARAEYALAQAEADRAVQQARMRKEALPGNFFADDEVEQAEEDAAGVDEHFNQMIAERENQLERYQKILQGFTMSQFPSRGASASDGGSGGSEDPLGAQQLRVDLDELINKLDPTIAKMAQFRAAQGLLQQGLEAGEFTQEEYNLRMEQLNELFRQAETSGASAASGVKRVNDELERGKTPLEEFEQGTNSAFDNFIRNIDGGKDALKQFILEMIKLSAIKGISSLLYQLTKYLTHFVVSTFPKL